MTTLHSASWLRVQTGVTAQGIQMKTLQLTTSQAFEVFHGLGAEMEHHEVIASMNFSNMINRTFAWSTKEHLAQRLERFHECHKLRLSLFPELFNGRSKS